MTDKTESDTSEEWEYGPDDFQQPDFENLDEEQMQEMMQQREQLMQSPSPTWRMFVTFLIGIAVLSLFVVGPVLYVWWFHSFDATMVTAVVIFLWFRFVWEAALEG